MSISYGLTAEYQGTVNIAGPDEDPNEVPTYRGGVLAIGGDHAFNVLEALEAGNGIITVADTDTALITALDAYGPLKRVTTPDDAQPVSSYEAMSLADLRGTLKARGVEGAGKLNKAAAITALTELDSRAASGDLTVNDVDDVDDLTNTDAAGDGQEG